MNVLSLNIFRDTIVKKNNAVKPCGILSVIFLSEHRIFTACISATGFGVCMQACPLQDPSCLAVVKKQTAGAAAPGTSADVAGKLAGIRFPVSGALMA